MKRLRFGAILAFLCVALTASAKPIAVVRCVPYSRYDADHLTMKILHPAGKSYEVFTDPLPVEKFADYSAVFILLGAPAPDEEGIGKLDEYIRNGGILVLTASAPRGFGGKWLRQGKFPGLRGVSYNRLGNKDITIRKPDHPLMRGISALPAWLARSQFRVTPADGAEVIAANDAGDAAIVEYAHGKGRVIYIGHAYLRTDRKDPADAESYTRIMDNLVKTLPDAAPEEELTRRFPGEKLLIWRRMWSKYPEARPQFEPNYPRPDELCSEIAFFSAVGERDTQFFAVQSPEARELPVTPPKDRRFTLLKMSKAAPMYSLLRKGQPREWAEAEGNYYLRPAGNTVKLLPGLPEVFAVRLDTDGMAPGEYRDTVRIGEKEIALRAAVYPISLAGRRKVDLRSWGYSLPTDRPATLEMYRLHNMVQVDLPLIRWSEVKIKSTGETLAQALKRDPEPFKKLETFPELEFSPAMLEALRVYAERGLYVARVRGLSINRFLIGVNGGKPLPTDEIDWSDAVQSAYVGFYRELSRFYRSRGYCELFLSTFDEPKPDAIRKRVLPAIRMRHAAGIKSGASWTWGTLKDKEVLKELGPIACWSVYSVIAHEIDRLNADGELGNAKDFGFFIGSTPETRRPSEYGRTYARYLFSLSENFRYALVGPCWKEWLYYGRNPVFGVWGQRLFAWGDPEKRTILNCAFLEGVRDGIDDCNLNWHLQYLLRKLAPFAGKDKALAAALSEIAGHSRNRLEALAFRKHDVSSKQTDKPYQYVKLGPDMAPVQSELFKKSILDDLMTLKPFAEKYLRPEVNYRGIDLSSGAKISGAEIPWVKNDPSSETEIVCSIDAGLGAKDWRIAVENRRIAITGGDADGLALGIRMFTHGLDVSGGCFQLRK